MPYDRHAAGFLEVEFENDSVVCLPRPDYPRLERAIRELAELAPSERRVRWFRSADVMGAIVSFRLDTVISYVDVSPEALQAREEDRTRRRGLDGA